MKFDAKWRHDLLASMVVFLVALPLCMGIAIASGCPPSAGLLTGIIGGIVVASLSGCPLQVSGPAAGLTVMVFEIVNKFGVAALGPVILVAGLIQFAFGVFKLGRVFRAVSPAVVQGMLSGIGLLILASQFHVMLDGKPKGTGLDNLLNIPSSLIHCLNQNHDMSHIAALTGLITIAIILFWEKMPFEKLRSAVPSALLAILTVTTLSVLLSWDVNRVTLPENLFATISFIDLNVIPKMGWTLLEEGLAIALIASAETLLTANAVDRILVGNKSQYDKELLAQGVGNTLCGLVGALPLTGVIVRSSVNIKAGAKTRLSAILHGCWLLLFVLFCPNLLRLIPSAALAALLVYTGYKLLDIKSIQSIGKYGKSELFICLATMATIIFTDLLTGVITGIVLSVLKLLYVFCQLNIHTSHEGNRTTLKLYGSATFLSLPKLTEELEKVPHDADLHIDITAVSYIDHACFDLFDSWEEKYAAQGADLTIDWHVLQNKANRKLLAAATPAPASSDREP